MNRINRHKFGPVFAIVFFAMIIVGFITSAAVPALASPLAARKTSSLAYHDEWRKLWEDHITWTRVVIMGILNELPGTGTYVDRLLQNSVDMEDALKPYYGDEAEVLGALIRDHLVIAAEILDAANVGDTARLNNAVALWYENAEDIAVQMNKMNPKFWPLDESRRMWIEHLDATLEEATAHLSGDFEREVAAYDLVHDLALEMADFFSNGVIRQFPQNFRGGVPH